MYPNRPACLRMMDSHNMLSNIKAHSIRVADTAVYIGRAVNKSGADLDIALIESASLLHDITKTRSLQTRENHSKTGGELLRNLGHQRIAELVEQHVLPDNIEGKLSEEEVVCYADKRVLHDKIVSLNERFDYLLKRYGKTDKKIGLIHKTKKKLVIIEKRIIESCSSSEFNINKIIV